MSSHHFVREDQEPALLILSTEAVPFAIVQELLEWSPAVLVSELVLNDVLLWGIKIDVVIALSKNADGWRASLKDQFPVKILSCNSEDEIVSTGLYFLIASKQRAVNILSDLPLVNFETFDSLDLCVFQSGRKWSLIRSGTFEKWLPKGTTLHVFPLNDQAVVRTETDGVLTIHREGNFWVSEE